MGRRHPEAEHTIGVLASDSSCFISGVPLSERDASTVIKNTLIENKQRHPGDSYFELTALLDGKPMKLDRRGRLIPDKHAIIFQAS